jgi:hypothetical protein
MILTAPTPVGMGGSNWDWYTTIEVWILSLLTPPPPFFLAVLAMGIVGIEIGEIIYVPCMYINFKIGIKYHMVECVMLNVNDKS